MRSFSRRNLIVDCISKAYLIHQSKARPTHLSIMHGRGVPTKISTSRRIIRARADPPAPSTAKALNQCLAGLVLSPRLQTIPLPSKLLPIRPRIAWLGATPLTIPSRKTWVQWAISKRIWSRTLLKKVSPFQKWQAQAATRKMRVKRRKRYSKALETSRKKQLKICFLQKRHKSQQVAVLKLGLAPNRWATYLLGRFKTRRCSWSRYLYRERSSINNLLTTWLTHNTAVAHPLITTSQSPTARTTSVHLIVPCRKKAPLASWRSKE